MLFSSMSEVSTAANFRNGEIPFSLHFLTVVDSILDQALVASAFSVMCKDSIPTKVPRVGMIVVFIATVRLFTIMPLIRSSHCLPVDRLVLFYQTNGN